MGRKDPKSTSPPIKNGEHSDIQPPYRLSYYQAPPLIHQISKYCQSKLYYRLAMASLILAVGRRRAVSSIISTRRNAPAVVRSLQSASAATASSSGSFETNKEISRGMRFSAALTAAAAVAAGGMMWGNNEKADCTAIAAVVGKDDFNARCVIVCVQYTKYMQC